MDFFYNTSFLKDKKTSLIKHLALILGLSCREKNQKEITKTAAMEEINPQKKKRK